MRQVLSPILMSKPLLAACLLAATFLSSSMAQAANVAVPMDEVRIVTFKEPVSSVYVGNPTIADVTTIDSRRVFLLGKTFGQTNMIALNREGRPIANDQITVYGRRGGSVTLNKGTQQYSYSCTAAHCAPAPVPGDVAEFHKGAQEQVQSHAEMSRNAATPK